MGGIEERMQAKLDRKNMTKNGRMKHKSKADAISGTKAKGEDASLLLLRLASFISAFHCCVYPSEETLVECYKPLDLALLRSLSQETSANTQKRHENKF